MATVLSDTLTSATSYSSGPLNVSAFRELSCDFNVTATDGVALQFSRIGADGVLYPLCPFEFDQAGRYSLDIGIECTGSFTTSLITLPRSFGDSLQLDLVGPVGNAITTTISITGK